MCHTAFSVTVRSMLQDKFWNVPTGETLKKHVFEVSSEDPTNMSVQVYCDGPQKNSCLKAKGEDGNRGLGSKHTHPVEVRVEQDVTP